MKLWRLRGRGLDALQSVEEDPALPGRGEVQVRMQAAALNYRDIGVVSGVYPAADGIIPLSDGAGCIITVGDGVDGFKVGDDIISCFYEDWQAGPGTPENHRRSFGCERDGMLAQIVTLPVCGIIAKPRSLSAIEASTLTCAGLTAWTALFTEAGLEPGQHVVVQGTGGVAIFAIQFAKMAGATVTVISSSDSKLERARLLGADHLVNYRKNTAWSAEVMNVSNGRGADVVLELGGPQTFPQSLACLKMDGHIAVIGLLSGIEAPLSIPLTLSRRARIHGITVGHRQDMLAMAQAIEANALKPVVDRVYAFGEAHQAYEDLPRGEHFGKLAIEI